MITMQLMCSSFRKLCYKSDSIKKPSDIVAFKVRPLVATLFLFLCLPCMLLIPPHTILFAAVRVVDLIPE
jgi:hypothetical protein